MFQLAECVDISNDWNQCELEMTQASTAKNKEKANENLRKLSNHKGNCNVYHFLPKLTQNKDLSIGPFLIDFSKIRSVSRNEEDQVTELTQKKIATVTPEFLPSIVERLGSFFSRIGTPDYSHPD